MDSPDEPAGKASYHHLLDSPEAPQAAKASSSGAGRRRLAQPHPPLRLATAGPTGLTPPSAVYLPVEPPPDKASSHRSVAPSTQGILSPPPPNGQPGGAAASWAAIVSHRPVAPPSQDLLSAPPPHGQSSGAAASFPQPPPLPHRQPGRAATSWAAIVSSQRPVAPSSQDLLPSRPPHGLFSGATASFSQPLPLPECGFVDSSHVQLGHTAASFPQPRSRFVNSPHGQLDQAAASFFPRQPPPPHEQPAATTISLPQPPHGQSGRAATSLPQLWQPPHRQQDVSGRQGPSHGQSGRAATSLPQLSPPPHRQPSRAGHQGPPHGLSRHTVGCQASHRRLMVSTIVPDSSHGLMISPDASLAGKASIRRYPNWVMLDPHTRLNYHPNEDFLGTHAVTETSRGEHIDISFRSVMPPGASRLYVHWTPRRRTKGQSSLGARKGEDRCGWDPIVVAAHENSILLQLTFENTQSDFFVYTLPSTGPPSLMLLPSCKHKFTDGIPRSGGLDHMSIIEGIGLLCNAEREKFVVADLMILPNPYKDDDAPVVAELCVLQGSHSKDGWTTTPWRAIRPQIHHDNEHGKELVWWETDVVVPLHDSLCYVDYFRGIFFVDVLSENPELHYVQLPVLIPNGDPTDPETGVRGCPEQYRSVCVTNNGCILKFVEVVTTTVFVSGSREPASSSFAIKVWKLTQDSMTWEKEYVMADTELWALQGCGDLLRVAPSFPFVSMEEPEVVYFVLSNRYSKDPGALWVIVVDMLKKTVRSLSRYNKVYPNCIGSDDDMASASFSTNSAFIPCAFSKYVPVWSSCVEPRGRG